MAFDGLDETKPADRIVIAIMMELTSKSGLDGAWDSINQEIKDEIIEQLLYLVQEELDLNKLELPYPLLSENRVRTR